MKKILYSALMFLLCVPVILFAGCSSVSKFPSITPTTYFSEKVSSTLFNGSAKELSIKDLSSNSPNKKLLDTYYQIDISANSSWLYKMYIDCIYFKVYTQNKLDSQVTITIKITNTVKEEDISKENAEKDFSATCAFTPKKNGTTECKIKVGRTVADLTGAKITIDVSEYQGGIVMGDENVSSDLLWIIYNFRVYGESRSYSK